MKAASARTILLLLLGLVTSTTWTHAKLEVEEEAEREFESIQLSPTNLGSSPAEAHEFFEQGQAHAKIEEEEEAGRGFESVQLCPSDLGTSPAEAHEFLEHGKAHAEVKVEEEAGREFKSVQLSPSSLGSSPAEKNEFLEHGKAHAEEAEAEKEAEKEFESVQLGPSNFGYLPAEVHQFFKHRKSHAEVKVEEVVGREFESVQHGPSNLGSLPDEAHKLLAHGNTVLTTMLDFFSYKLLYDCYNQAIAATEKPSHILNQLMENSEGTINLIAAKLGDKAFDPIVLCMAILINVPLVWRFKFVWAIVFDILLYSAYAYFGSKAVVGCCIGIALLLYDLLAVCAGHPVQVAVTVFVLILVQCLLWPTCRRHFWPSQTDRLEQQAKILEQRLDSIEQQLGCLVEMLTDQGTQQEQVIDICERVERRLQCSGPLEDIETDED